MLRTSLTTAVLCVFGFLASADVAANAATSSYTVTVIGPFNRTGRDAVAMNSQGHVTGEGAGNGLFLYDGSLHLLGKPAGSDFAVGQGISDGDVIAATVQKDGVRSAYAVTYANGHSTWTRLPGLPGYDGAQASGILPDGSAITGTLCPTGDRACARGLRPPQLAVVWRRSAGKYLAPIVLPVGKGPFASTSAGIARDNTITAVVGNIVSTGTGGGPEGTKLVVWTLRGYGYLTLSGSSAYPYGSAYSIAHGSGNTFYIAGQAADRNGSAVTQGVLWTIRCTVTRCRQTNRQVLTTFGQVLAVNSHGAAVGYSRPNGDGGGFDALWQGGQTITIPATPLAINAAGEIAGWRINPSNYHLEVVLLKPAT